MKSRGFTLFTALVSFVLIMLSVLIIQSMVQSERDKVELIAGIEEQSEMQAMADLTRADAIQYFNYGVRFQIENYLSESGTGSLPLSGAKSWEGLKQDFIETFFASCGEEGVKVEAFANALARDLVLLTGFGAKNVGFYRVSLEEGIPGGSGYQTVLAATLAKAFCKSAEGNGVEFLEVVGCEDGNPNDCVGTFYINLDLTQLSEEEYESLPRIQVSNTRSKRTIAEPILPRGHFRIYVPLRIFKAFAEARALAYEFNKETNNSTGWGKNYGLFSPRIHNELEEMRLGMCDEGYCRPRENFFVPPKKKGIEENEQKVIQSDKKNGLCPGDPNWSTCEQNPDEWKCKKYYKLRCPSFWYQSGGGNICSGSLYYNPGDPQSMKSLISEYAKKRLCFLANKNYGKGLWLNADPNDGFMVVGENNLALPNPNAGCPINEVVINTSTKNSKKIVVEQGSVSNVSNGFSGNYTANKDYGSSGNCPMQNGGVGFWINGSDLGVSSIDSARLECNGLTVNNPSTEGIAQCTEISTVTLTLKFRETNQDYIVNKGKANAEGGIDYKVKITDSFTPFTPKFSASLDSSTCALTSDAEENEGSCSAGNSGDWTCVSYYKKPALESDNEGRGCKPVS